MITSATVGPDDSSFESMVERQKALAEVMKRDPDVVTVMSTVGGGGPAATQNSGRMFITLRDKPARRDDVTTVIARLRKEAEGRPGFDLRAFAREVTPSAHLREVIRAAYAPVLPVAARDAAHALRLAARMGT